MSSRLMKFLLLAFLLCINLKWIAAQTTESPDTDVSVDDDDSDTSTDSDTSLDTDTSTDTDTDDDTDTDTDTDTVSVDGLVAAADDDSDTSTDSDTDDDDTDTSTDSDTSTDDDDDTDTTTADGLVAAADDDDSDTSTDSDTSIDTDSDTSTDSDTDTADADTVDTEDDDDSDTSTDTSTDDSADTSTDTSTDTDDTDDSVTGLAAPNVADCDGEGCNAGMSGDKYSGGYNSAQAGSVEAATVNGVLAAICVILGLSFMVAVGGFVYYYQKDKARRNIAGIGQQVAMSEVQINGNGNNDLDALPEHTAYRPKIQAVDEDDEELDFDGQSQDERDVLDEEGPLHTDL